MLFIKLVIRLKMVRGGDPALRHGVRVESPSLVPRERGEGSEVKVGRKEPPPCSVSYGVRGGGVESGLISGCGMWLLVGGG